MAISLTDRPLDIAIPIVIAVYARRFEHMILNIMGLHFIGGQMLLRLIGEKWFLLLFAASTFAGTLLNNFLKRRPRHRLLAPPF